MKYYEIQDLLDLLDRSGKPHDKNSIINAYDLANAAHKGQCRVSGEPYISHPIAVAMILADLGMDDECIQAALLHDVVEDTEIPLEQISRQFGSDVALLVNGVTKLGQISYQTSREERQAENVRKMLLAMAQDVRVIIIKLADRLHNMRTIEVMPEQKRRDKALETMEVYAPLAHRLGIRAVKEELEDRSLRYLDPVAYREIERMLALKQVDRQNFLEKIKQKIRERLSSEYSEIHIDGRVKSVYGIYRKMYMQGRAFEEIFDIYAVRIIVDSVMDCYNVLGIIHDLFQPIPNRFKDYISTPKPNMYQSLHTTVIDKEAIPFEVQIRTWDMHHTAEYGIAAHWKYKAGISGKDKLEERLAWIRQLIENQKEADDVEDIVHSIKSDLAPEEVYVFTPKGRVISLPVGSTVIDFAYAIHTEVGNRMVGAKVDGRMVALDTKVHTGQIIEIITTNSKDHTPSRDWLKIAKTSQARNKIRNWYKKERREENIEQGRNELEREFRRNMISLPDGKLKEFLLGIARRQHFEAVEDFLAAVGYGGVLLSKIMPRIKDDFTRQYRSNLPEDPTERVLATKVPPRKNRRASSGVIVEGLDSCLVKFARCCNPLPGDEIIGFVTRGYGVSIHKKDCQNVVNSLNDPNNAERWVHSEWAMESAKKESFKSTIEILTDGRIGSLADISVALSSMRISISTLVAREAKQGENIVTVTFTVSDIEQLQFIINNLSKIPGVESVSRSVQ
ncbi:MULTISPECIES: bifunctional (p)ppGpp synthetase/guanosine-3',5'-bis(diphosphate) 3'-pyrophosphohydrolase [unclassified Anaerotruncus]|uniref:RelA/SpoT family protein n=1 Tax=unclassified Anaerotruncus TaxID=2641626 RepID=UPI00033708E6|nr:MULTISPECIES: bifunctional (p)ppGpp synthetase/guanosine-3',5'-bis(diphosphate) 3'-pyrophosphohydrolase [unclassified Anaerotruncus]EOS61502.1 RelA/SpoT family protein [Anaerotruncus sp. G3(2012)]MCI9159594.1 bifunctional (p)ppGpp synthetase/guanosine-3',5'-bis(diphosphate) 3'-pyrophosphohydrolase [Anaerotruncus sp.]NBK17290.1 bifunctional (p)ppGpp synthetase/guanosine-3',5'-bis(diphosphate) 3'-pyrophosphohydrolase [Anaerotruncus sp. 1XD42-93]RKJ97950.1 bifunctional (p)ppGpp synthetase/guano